jgi:hypothetical protein
VAHARAISRCVRIADESGEELFGRKGIMESWPSNCLLAGGARASSIQVTSVATVSASPSDRRSSRAVDWVPTKRRNSTIEHEVSREKKTGTSDSAQPDKHPDEKSNQSAAPAKQRETLAIAGATASDMDKEGSKRNEGQRSRGQKRPAQQSQTSASSVDTPRHSQNKTELLTKQLSSQSHACTPCRPIALREKEFAEQVSDEKGRPKAAKSLEVATTRTVADLGSPSLNQHSECCPLANILIGQEVIALANPGTESGAVSDHGKSAMSSSGSEYLKVSKVPTGHQPLSDKATDSVQSITPRARKEVKGAHTTTENSLHAVGSASLSKTASAAAAAADSVAARVPIKIPRKTDGHRQSSMPESVGKAEASGVLQVNPIVDVPQTKADNRSGNRDNSNLSVHKGSIVKSSREKHASIDSDGGGAKHLSSESVPAVHLQKHSEQRKTSKAPSGQDGSKGVTEGSANKPGRRDSNSLSSVQVLKQAKQGKEHQLHTNAITGQRAVSDRDRTARPEPIKETWPRTGPVPGELPRKSLPDPASVVGSAKGDNREVRVRALASTGKDLQAPAGKSTDPDSSAAAGTASAPPIGWTRHWSKTWGAHYIFNPKTGEQRWESGGPQEGVVNGGKRSGLLTKGPTSEAERL